MQFYDEFNPVKFNTYTSRKKNVEYKVMSDDILTFDTETSTGFFWDNEIHPYIPYLPDSFYNEVPKYNLCYIWQFSFNEETYYGRELNDFLKVLDKLPSNVKFIIYVHNLGYDFTQLLNILTVKDVFARTSHSPMKVVFNEYPNVEFRCSYILTRLSLADWGLQLGLPKRVGDLAYNELRTPNTPLTEKELGYCERDCQVIYKGIQAELKEYKHIESIPLTQTGKIRRECRKRLNKDRNNHIHMNRLIPSSPRMYAIMKKCFMGGYTHANFTLAGRILDDCMAFDFASSYPFVMCSEDKFPTTPFKKDVFDWKDTDIKVYLLKIKFTNLKSKLKNHYISFSVTSLAEYKKKDIKAFKKRVKLHEDYEVDNGRLIFCNKPFTMWTTSIDFDIIRQVYDFDYEIIECYSSMAGRLHKELVRYILELYGNKTQYKDVEDYESIYQQSKQYINGVFGMSVTDICQDNVTFDGMDWSVKECSVKTVKKTLDKLREDRYGKNFLAYQFGIFITALARHNLWECLIPNDDVVAYADTDSLYIWCKDGKRPDFSWYNKKAKEKIDTALQRLGIDIEMSRPKTPKGVVKQLGEFTIDKEKIKRFKTLGAKRYCYEDEKGLHITVSGINKGAVECLKGNMNLFKDDFVFYKDRPSVTKKLKYYLNDMQPIIWNEGKPDQYYSTQKFGMALRPTSYHLGITPEYLQLIKQNGIQDHLKCITDYEIGEM